MTIAIKTCKEDAGYFRPVHKIQGAKFDLLPRIAKSVLKAGLSEDSIWVEPFMGTGVVGFNLAPKRAFFYDINPHVINLYRGMKDGSITLNSLALALNYHKAQFAKFGNEHYLKIRKEFNESGDPMLFLLINRTSYNGVVRFSKKSGFNVPYCKNDKKLTDSLIDSLMESFARISNLIRQNDWHFEVADFNSAIKKHADDPRAHYFCDPPYVGRNTQYYTGWTMAEEESLFQGLDNSKGAFTLTTWHSDFVIPKITIHETVGENTMSKCQYLNKSVRRGKPTNEAFIKYWSHFSNDTFIHKYLVGGGSKRIGIFESIVYRNKCNL